MSDERMEVIVVGGGLAGLSAAYTMARAGMEVLLIERGSYCGAKNVTGGKLCADVLKKLIPSFEEELPVERRLIREQAYAWSGSAVSETGLDVRALQATKYGDAYSVLRAKLDQWLCEKAEEEGVMVINNITVTGLLIEDGKVCGVMAGDERMEAGLVILADGANSLLAQQAGLGTPPERGTTCVGVKEVIQLGEGTVNSRFGLAGDEGVEYMYLGDRSAGNYADGFIYTNRDSVSVGIEFLIGDIDKTDKAVPELLEEFKELPAVAELIEGGTLLEYSAHIVHHGGSSKLGRLCGDGVLIAGDAAGLVANYGFTIRGMDLAVESGILAAETAIALRESGDYSAEALSAYQQAVEASGIFRELRRCEEYMNETHGGV